MSSPITRFENQSSTANQAGRQNIKGNFVQHNSYHWQVKVFHTDEARLLTLTCSHVYSAYDNLRQQTTSLGSQTTVTTTGLLLSTLPAFISAAGYRKSRLENRKHSIKKWKFAVQYEEELTQLRLSLLGYVKVLVNETTLTPELQLALCNSSENESWENSEVAEQMCTVLGTNSRSYIEFLSKTCEILANQVTPVEGSAVGAVGSVAKLKHLNLRPLTAGTIPEHTEPWNKINFSCTSTERSTILGEIRACNQQLLKLCKKNDLGGQRDRVEPASEAVLVADTSSKIDRWKHESAHAAFERREIHQRLFEALQSTCKCVPSGTQDIGLRLQVFTSNNDHSMDSNFQMLLFLSRDVICQLSAKMASIDSQILVNKKARFAEPEEPNGNSELLIAASSMKPVKEICHEVTHAHASAVSLDLFVDEHGAAFCTSQPVTASHSTPRSTGYNSRHVISLADIMSRLRLYSQKTWLKKEKSALAIILAYSQLHLHDSPWLQFQWSSDTITFIDDGSITQKQPRINLQGHLLRPYTRSQPKKSSKAGVVGSSAQRVPPRRCAHLRALGVVLLELFLHDSFHNSLVIDDGNDVYAEALDVLLDHADDDGMTHEYYEAVRFCLSPTPSPRTKLFSFDDEGFRELYYQQVILNLQHHFTIRFGDTNLFP